MPDPMYATDGARSVFVKAHALLEPDKHLEKKLAAAKALQLAVMKAAESTSTYKTSGMLRVEHEGQGAADLTLDGNGDLHLDHTDEYKGPKGLQRTLAIEYDAAQEKFVGKISGQDPVSIIASAVVAMIDHQQRMRSRKV